MVPNVSLSQISAAADGELWGLNKSDGKPMRYDATKNKFGSPSNTALISIAVGSKSFIWGLHKDKTIYSYTAGAWAKASTQSPVALTSLSAAADGSLWGATSQGVVYSYSSSTGWVQQNPSGTPALTSISVGSASNIWGLDAQGQPWTYTATDKQWVKMSTILPNLDQISVSSKGVVYGVRSGIVYAYVGSAPDSVVTQSQRLAMTPLQAYQTLKEGNQRFDAGNSIVYNYPTQRGLIDKQYPFAFVLDCMDSRCPPEILFDQSLGSIFVGRVAGNVIDTNLLGSMEYALHLDATAPTADRVKIVIVLGHLGCGAVSGVCPYKGANSRTPNLNVLLQQIKPAASACAQCSNGSPDANCRDEVAEQNVQNMMKKIIDAKLTDITFVTSTTDSKASDPKQVLLLGGLYNISQGTIKWIEYKK